MSHLASGSQIMLPVTGRGAPRFAMALRLCQLDAGLVMTRTERFSEELIPLFVAFLLVLFIIISFSRIVFDRPHLLFKR